MLLLVFLWDLLINYTNVECPQPYPFNHHTEVTKQKVKQNKANRRSAECVCAVVLFCTNRPGFSKSSRMIIRT